MVGGGGGGGGVFSASTSLNIVYFCLIAGLVGCLFFPEAQMILLIFHFEMIEGKSRDLAGDRNVQIFIILF